MNNKESIIFIEHIIECIENIELFTKGVSKEDFLKNKEKQSAIIRQIEIIGEAVKNISESFKSNYSNILWKDIAGMRDKLMHHYFGIDLEIVWKTIKEDIPLLKSQILNIKRDLENSNKK
jgi:uncharacterized protein with HEPN domain